MKSRSFPFITSIIADYSIIYKNAYFCIFLLLYRMFSRSYIRIPTQVRHRYGVCMAHVRRMYGACMVQVWRRYGAGTTVITALINLNVHPSWCYNSRKFVNPTTGAYANNIEGTWTHAQKKHGSRKTEDTLKQDLTEFMWRKQRGLTRITDAYRQMFSGEIP